MLELILLLFENKLRSWITDGFSECQACQHCCGSIGCLGQSQCAVLPCPGANPAFGNGAGKIGVVSDRKYKQF